ncbi:MAG: 16S rRNA (guanine(966)-N(2))-methyltransferase RsmD [Ruminococcus sp.]|jgi:16S rRNA (guanine(966)-N(2))-methyltransferase RsmD|nr:16S rRNA (guanine(966)-N(2))-methyltransferase RsmD [Ruminococcus sp.]
MRVITGSARGRRLKTPDGFDVRPTTDKVKESIFSIIQFNIPGAAVLDLFSGSGQLGIEALSRGAKSCTFVDKSPESVKITLENITACGFLDISTVKRNDAESFVKICSGRGERFDIAFLDPPYDSSLLGNILPNLADIMNDGGIVILEHGNNFIPADSYAGKLFFDKSYSYGKINLTKLSVKDVKENAE